MPLEIGIVGGGCSGALTAFTLLRTNKDLRVHLYQTSEETGRGIAYQMVHDEWLLNVPTNLMGAYNEDKQHFLKWLQEKGLNAERYSFVERSLYGEYLSDLTKHYLASEKDRLFIHNHEVLDIKNAGDQSYVFILPDGDSSPPLTHVILACGNPPSSVPIKVPESANGIFQSSWDFQALEQLKDFNNVVIFGSGLTAVDVALKLTSQSKNIICTMLSRHGLLPSSHAEAPLLPADITTLMPFSPNILQLFSNFKRIVQKNCKNDWRSVIDALRAHTNSIWAMLPNKEKNKFIRHLRSYWEAGRHRFAPEISRKINKRMQEGRVRIVAGRVKEVISNASGLNLQIALRSRRNVTLETEALINCSGSGTWQKSENSLIRNISSSGLVNFDYLGWGLVTNERRQIISKDFGTLSRLFAIGPLCRGTLYETTAVREIREQAELITSTICSESR